MCVVLGDFCTWALLLEQLGPVVQHYPSALYRTGKMDSADVLVGSDPSRLAPFLPDNVEYRLQIYKT